LKRNRRTRAIEKDSQYFYCGRNAAQKSPPATAKTYRYGVQKAIGLHVGSTDIS
jgi:hypothetical protein